MRNSSTATIVTITRLSDDPDTSVNISDLDLPGWVFSDIMECISYAMITVAFFGIIGNSLIMVTLIKIGFSTSINISFCALCVSDFLCVAALGWNAVCFVPAFGNSDLPFKPREVVIPTGGGLSDIFCGTTAWITAFISFERCLCVVFPMKIKTIVSPGRALFIVVTIFFITIFPLTYITFYLYLFEKKFDKKKNRSLIGVEYRNSYIADTLNHVNFMYKMICINSIPLAIILVCSIALAVSLKKSVTWREKQSSTNRETLQNSSRRKSSKDTRVAKTVLAIAMAFILLGGLTTLRHLASVTWPEFRVIGAYSRSYRSVARLTFLFSLINSSVNFLIYYNTGSKFRHTVKQMLCFEFRQ